MQSLARGIALLLVTSFLAVDAVAQDSPKGAIEEIVVRARKRDEFIQDTPVSVTALSESFLNESGVARLDDIQGLAPNIIFNTGLQGLDANIKIRGVGTAIPALAFDPGVGVYMDGVFMPRALGALLDVIDVQQIEVLRGPQGTLFGKNTVGGALLVTTVKPHDEVEGHLRVRAGNFYTVETKATLNVPLVEERLLSRFSFGSRNTRGYTYNRTRDEYSADHQSQNILGSFRVLPDIDSPLLPHTIDISAQYSRNHTKGRGGECRFINPDASLVRLGLIAGDLRDDFVESCNSSNPFSFEADLPNLADIESYGAWGTFHWDLLELSDLDLSLKSLSSWRQQKSRIRFDIENTGVRFLERHQVGGEIDEGKPTRQRQINQEIQLNASAWDDRIHAVGGFFLFWEDSNETSVQKTPFLGPIETTTEINFSFDNWTGALFGQTTLDVTDWLSLTGGVRRTADKKSATRREFNLRNLDENGNPLQTFPVDGREGNGVERTVFYNTTWLGTVKLTATDDILDALRMDHLMGYFTFSQGFKGGGFNAAPSGQVSLPSNRIEAFEPETLDNFEVGFKTRSFEDKLSLNLSLFWGEYDNIQLASQRTAGINPTTGLPTIARIIQNAGEARVRGVETEFSWIPFPEILIMGSVGYTDTEYLNFGGAGVVDGRMRSCTEDLSADPNDADAVADVRRVIDQLKCAIDDRTGLPTNRSGQRFIGVPALQTSLTGSYSLPINLDSDSLTGELTPLVQWSYQSSTRFLGQEVDEGRQHGYHLLNARLSYDFLDDRAYVALWAKNLLDVAYFNHAFSLADSFGHITRYYQSPRTYGGEISFRF